MAFAWVASSSVPVSPGHLSTKEFIYATRPYRRCASGAYCRWRDLRANPNREYDRRSRPAVARQGVRTSGQHVELYRNRRKQTCCEAVTGCRCKKLRSPYGNGPHEVGDLLED